MYMDKKIKEIDFSLPGSHPITSSRYCSLSNVIAERRKRLERRVKFRLSDAAFIQDRRLFKGDAHFKTVFFKFVMSCKTKVPMSCFSLR